MIHLLRNQLGSIRSVYLPGNQINRRDDFADFPETVLLLHGFFQTRNIWQIMEKRLRQHNYGVLSLNLGGFLWRYNTRSILSQAEWLAEKIEHVRQKHQLGKLNIVGHSMGGLVARHYVQSCGGAEQVKSLITLGSPHHGTPTALIGIGLMAGGLLSRSPFQMLPQSKLIQRLQHESWPEDIPLCSIFSTQDLICPWWCSVLRKGHKEEHIQNIRLKNIGHSELVSHPKIFQVVLSKLNAQSKDRQHTSELTY